MVVKNTETREEALARLARGAHQGAGAAKCFEALVKRVAKTPTPAARSKESAKGRYGFLASENRRAEP